MVNKNLITFILKILLLICIGVIQIQAQTTLVFPPKIMYSLSKDNQPLGNATLFYTQNTGIQRFNRDISSLRLTIFQQAEDDFQFLFESYLFSENLSLCSDWQINNDRIKTTQLELPPHSFQPNETNRYFISSKENQSQNQQLPVQKTYRTISRLSSLLLVSALVADPQSNQLESLNYLTSTSSNQTRFIFKGKETTQWKGKRIQLHVLALMQNNQELHRYKVVLDPNGYCFPFNVVFNINNPERRLELTIQELPTFIPPPKLVDWHALFLNFVPAESGAIDSLMDIEKTLHEAVRKEIEKQLRTDGIKQNKQVVVTPNISISSRNKIKEIIDFALDDLLPIHTRIDRIFSQLNIPAEVDVLVSGQYINQPGNRWFMIRPIIIIKSHQKILSQNLLVSKDEVICQSTDSNQPILCQNALDYITAKLKKNFSLTENEKNCNQGLTIEDVYRMIIKQGFLCYSTDYGYFAEVLERLRTHDQIDQLESVTVTKPQPNGKTSGYSYTFNSSREITRGPAPGKELVLKTISVNTNNFSDSIELFWAPMEGKMETYPSAQQLISHLNSIKYQGFSDWRLPTLKELLSISQYNNKTNAFFPFLFPSKNIKIWSSTPLDEMEKKRVAHCEQDVYFAVDCIIEQNRHWLQFDVICRNNQGYVVPVRSIQSGRTIVENAGQQKLYIANLNLLNNKDKSPMTTTSLAGLINQEILKGMNLAVNNNHVLAIDEQGRRMFFSDENANQLANIFFDPTLTKEEKIENIVRSMMEPNHIDIVVTGIFVEDSKTGLITLRPTVIYGHDKKNRNINLQFHRHELLCRDPASGQQVLCQQAANAIFKAVKELLDQA